jgi:hypothetical protein
MTALEHWKYARSTCSTSSDSGLRPNSVKSMPSASAGSRLVVPNTRKVSSMPGTKNISAARGLPARLRRLSTRLLPWRSGIASRLPSSTRTKPGSPPRGDTSGHPSGEAVASVANGESLMKAVQWSSRWWITLSSTR